MRGYSLICREDNLAYDFVIANNAKEAKRIMIENQSDWAYDFNESPYVVFYAKWNKKANIEGLKLYEHVEGNELIKRKICSYLEYGHCEVCKSDDNSVSEMTDGTICCSNCEEKLE